MSKDSVRNCLVWGGGGREHALCDALCHAPSCGALYAVPGSDAIDESGLPSLPVPSSKVRDWAAEDWAPLVSLCRARAIDLVIVGPEQPLITGIADALERNKIAVLAPSAKAARIEGSKIWMKEMLVKCKIPTARFTSVDSRRAAEHYIAHRYSFPLVVKVDGLAAGKGVTIAANKREALQAIEAAMVEKRFGAAGEHLLFEDYLQGHELSYFALCDATGATRYLGTARDYKRALAGDEGANTGGMGAFACAPPHPSDEQKIKHHILLPILEGLDKASSAYKGIIFLGLIATSKGVKVLEINARMGDPEAQTLLPLCESDLVALFFAAATGKLREARELRFSAGLCSVSVVMTNGGYPAASSPAHPINNLEAIEPAKDLSIFHSGTKRCGDTFHSHGGRVLTVNARATTFTAAREKAYRVVKQLAWKDCAWRADIAEDKDTRALQDCCEKYLAFP